MDLEKRMINTLVNYFLLAFYDKLLLIPIVLTSYAHVSHKGGSCNANFMLVIDSYDINLFGN